MLGYLLFGLTAIAYLLLCILVLQPAPSGNDQTFGWSYSAFVLIVAYCITSLILTIYISANGGFAWLSESSIKRNIGVAIIWLGIIAGVVYCTLERTDYSKFYQITGFVRLFSNVIYYATIWLPLLMLIPYFLFLKPEWWETFSLNLLKFPLLFASLIGFLCFLSPKIMANILKPYKEYSPKELAFNEAMSNINKYQDVSPLLYYTSKSYDEKLRNAALTKIKANKNLEVELIDILESGSANTCYQVYDFLDENEIAQPERFIEPIIKSFATITADTYENIVNPYKSGMFNVEVLLRVLDKQFKGNTAVFKPHLIKLQEVMATSPAESRNYGDIKQINEELNKYREEVKKWLVSH
jgi:hypothetical protein